MTSSAMQPILREFESEHQRLSTLWEKLGDSNVVGGIDSSKVKEAKNYVTTARDSIKNAREVLSNT